MLNIVSNFRSVMKIVQNYSRFKFAFLIVSPVSLLLCTWIHWRIPYPKEVGYYAVTGDSSTVQGYAEALGIEQVLQTFLYISFSVILFLLFRMALSNLLSFFAVVMFMTNAQVVLVYLSAPFWDFSTAIIPLAAITGTIALLSSQHQNICFSHKMRRQMSTSIICLNIVIAVLYFRVYILIAGRSIAIFVSVIVVLMVSLLWLKSEEKDVKSSSGTIFSARGNDRLFFIPVLFTLFLLQPILGRGGNSYGLMILVVCSLFFLMTEELLRKGYKFIVVILLLLIVQLISGNDFAKMYSFIGWSGAEPLLSGRNGSDHALGVPRSDFLMWNLTEINAPSYSLYLQNVAINATTVISNLKIGWSYLSSGSWTFTEPPPGLNNSAVYMGRHLLIAPINFVASTFFVIAAIFLFQKSRKIAVFIALIVFSLLFSVTFSFPQMHQWWALQIFGIYGTLYVLSRVGSKLISIIAENPRINQRRGRTNRCSQLIFGLRSKISKKRLIQFSLSLLISAVGPGAVFGILNRASESLEINRLKELATRYASQDWQLITLNKGSKKFDFDRTSNFIKIEVSGNCNLAGVKVHYLNSDAPGLETGDFYRTKFHITNTNSKIVYIPFFPIAIARPAISISGLNSSCWTRVYQSNLKEQSLPLVALLVPNEENSKSKVFTDEKKTNLVGRELLSSPFSFEGYVNNAGYQAVGDELEHEWLNDQIGDRILGRSKQGYQEIDLWKKKIDVKADKLRVRVRGVISRGVLIIGWSESKLSSTTVIPTAFDYSIDGSIFDTSTRELYKCFELLAVNNIGEDSKIELFIGSVFDLYSPRWTSFQINSITLDQGSCETKPQPNNFLPTL